MATTFSERQELEALLNLFDSPGGIVLRDFLNTRADYYLKETTNLLRAGKVDESKVALAKHDATTNVLPAIRQRMVELREVIQNGNNV